MNGQLVQTRASTPHVFRDRLDLPEVTMCAVTSVNVEATIKAMRASIREVKFAKAILFTDKDCGNFLEGEESEIILKNIRPIGSSFEYSMFILDELINYIATPFCLIVQWDGHVLNQYHWSGDFLEYDYVGASWPQFTDGHDVGNGGFSLRSRKLMEACTLSSFRKTHPEDLAICRANRASLEAAGIRFAPRAVADRFSTERVGDLAGSFGYHGVFNMPYALGVDSFWKIYRTLDERSTVRHDLPALVRALQHSRRRRIRQLKLLFDSIVHWCITVFRRA